MSRCEKHGGKDAFVKRIGCMVPKFSILGDSISTFAGYIPADYRVYYDDERCQATGVHTVEDTWWMQVIHQLRGEFLANASFSGCLVEGPKFPAGCSKKRLAALSCGGIQPDVVLIFMGINDFGWGGAAAQNAARGASKDPNDTGYGSTQGAVAGASIPQTLERFEEAYDLLLERLRLKYSQAKVWCCTLCPGRVSGRPCSTFTYQLRGVHLDRYNDAIRRAAARHGCQVADIRAQGCDYDTLDGTHPTALGMQQLAAMIVRSIASDSRLPFPHQTFRSYQSCTKPCCVGCCYAAGTDNTWKLVCNRDDLCS